MKVDAYTISNNYIRVPQPGTDVPYYHRFIRDRLMNTVIFRISRARLISSQTRLPVLTKYFETYPKSLFKLGFNSVGTLVFVCGK